MSTAYDRNLSRFSSSQKRLMHVGARHRALRAAEPSSYITLTGLALCFGLAGWWRKRRRAA
jgi:hypothetical protein